MKRKLLFITLLMLFCSTMFGQGPEWQAPTQGTYEDYMSFTAMIQIDGANPNRSDLKIAAFNNGIVRGVGTSQIWNSDVTIVMFKIYGDKNDVLNFKLYVPGDNPEDDRILDTDFTIKLDPDYTGTSNVLNFYKKHFVVDNEYDLSMTVGATVRIDGVDPKRTDLDLAAFCGDEVRGVAKTIYWQSQDMYYYELIVGGRIDGEEITYKLYDPIADVDLLTDYKTTFKDGSTIDDGYGKPVTIEFKNNPVAMITNATGNHYFSSLEAAVAAAQDGEIILLLQNVTLTGTLTIEKNITIDGNGFEILPADDSKTYNSAIMVGNSGWGDDHGEVITLNNIEFNNWKSNYGVVRAQGVELNMEGCEFNGNDVSNAAYGVLSLNFTDATVMNSIFKKNTDRAIDINYNANDSNAVVTIDGCTFEENASEGAGIVVRNDGTQLVVKNSKFLNNTVTTSGNAAVLYAGWGTEDQITGCYFYGNNVTTSHATTIRFASAIFCDGCTVTGNAFENNTATRNGETITTTVAVGAYYGAANISENYWGKENPVAGTDYTVEYPNKDVAFNSYYKSYSDTEGLTDLVELNNVAKVGKYYYTSLAEAFAAVQNGETVKLLTDLTLDSETYTIADGKSVTLDMNGKKITVTDNKTINYELFYIYGGLTVIGDGTIELTATNDRDWNAMSAIFHNRGGVLTINNGTFKHLGGTDMAYVVDNSGNYYGDATTNINNGTLASTYIAIRNRMEQNTHGASGKAILNVYGGTINGERRAIWAQAASTSETAPATGEINISGGNIGLIETDRSTGAVSMTTISGGTVTEFKGEVNELKVTGGTLNDVTIMDASGNEIDYAVNKDGLYVAAVAKIGDKGYVSIQAAVNEAQDGNTVIVKEGKYNVFCPVGSDDNYTGRAHNLFVGKSITIKGEEGKEVVIYSYQETYTSTFDARITLLISGSDGVVIDNLTILPCYYPATITTDLSTVTGSEINALVGADNLKYYYNQIIDAMRNYNGTGQVSKNYIANITVKNCTIGDEAIPAENWGSAIYYPGAVGSATNFAGLTGGYTIENNVLFGGICICEGAAKDATTETCIIKNNTIHGGLFLNGKRPTGWNYVSLTVFPTVTGNTFTQAAGNTDGHAWFIGSRDGDAAAVIPTGTLEAYLANNTFTVASDKKAKVVVGNYAYSAEATEYYGLVSSEFIVDGEGTENNPYIITNLHELEAFRDAVNAGNDFSGKVFELNGDINLAATRAINNWEPIGTQANPFKGTFDGDNKTISNLVVEGENNVGLFGYATSATIKNVKLENVNVKGTDCVGAIAGQVYSTSLIDNCHVSGSIQVEGQTNVGGIVGKYYTKVKNCSVIGDDVATSYVKGTYVASDLEGDNIGGIMGHGGEDNRFENNTVKNITISGTRKVAGIVGVTDMNTQVKNCVVENVNIETTATAEYANSKKNTMSNGTLVGSYTTGNNTTGTVESCVVKNVNFLNPNNAVVSVGPITGGLRGGTDGMLAPTGVTASNNNIYMSTITGSNNLFLMNPVAKIGETEYYTLFDAVAAVQDGETKTITMLRNTAEEFAIDNTTANITLDMATYTLTGAITPSKANLIIENGTINNENASYSAIEINEGTLVLNDVKVTSKRHGVRIDGAVTATIDGGEYRLSATSGTRHAVNVSGDANVTIKAGTFVGPAGTTMDSGSAVCVQAGAKVTIEGGDFSGGKNATLGVSGTMTVTGGTFDQDVTEYCAEGYLCELNTTTNKYEVFRGLTGKGTEANPYLIKNLSDLTFFRDHVNAGETRYNATGVWVALANNIDMTDIANWTPIGNVDYNNKYIPQGPVFVGVFNGNGKVLSNLKIEEIINGGADAHANIGLFGITGEGAVIKNLTLTNVTINTDGRNVGALAGFAYKATLDNITVNGDIQIKGGNNVSGVAGMTRHYAMSATNINVIGDDGSAIIGNNIVGGIFAEIAPNGSEQTFNNLSVENVAITGASGVGGIVGLLTLGTVENVSVKNVVLTGRTDYQDNAMGRIRLGSVAGLMGGQKATIINPTVENVTAKNLDGNNVVLPIIGANYDASSNATEARIGDTYYATLKHAITAAQANEAITLLDNVTLAETATIEKAITLDLNDMTVTGADGAIVFNVNAATTIKNGTIKGNKSGTTSGLIDIYANLNLNEVTIETSKINALRFKADGCVATLEDCNVTGAFKGYGGSVWEIKSGTYKASSTSINDQLNGTASISGGTFHYEIAEDECAPGYVVQDNNDGTYTVKYAPAAFVDANNNGTLDEGEAVYGNLDQIFAKHKEGDVYVVLTSNIVANAQVDTDADAHYHFTTNVAEGVTMDFLFADDWNYIQKMSLGQNITLKAKYLLAWAELNVSGTINTDYLYTSGAATTIEATGVVNANTGDATIQVKNNATFTVKGKVNTAILNVWVNNAKLIVDGGIVNADWVDIWDGAPVVTLQNSAQLNVENIKASRGGEIVVTDATLTATGSIELGHNDESAGKLTESGNSTINGEIKLTATGSTVASDGGLNVTTDIPDHKVVYENGVYKLVAKVYVAEVNGVKYESLQEAVNVGGEVTVLQNITLTEGIVIPADKTVTLDLAGYTVSQTKEQTAGYQMILNDGTLTIKDSSDEKTGKLSYTDSGNGGEYISDVIYNRSVLVIDGGTIENLSSATVATNGYPHAVDTYSGIRNTSVTINGGTIYCAEYSAIRMFCVSATYTADLVINEGASVKGAIDMQNGTSVAALGTLTINGGTFETTKNANNIRFANWNGGATEYGITASVTGGHFNGGITTQYVPAAADFNKHFITGGTFAIDPTEYCAENYSAVYDPATQTYSVVLSGGEQVRDLVAGWSWFSTYIDLEGEAGLDMLQAALGTNGVQIKGQEGFTQYYSGYNAWSPGLTSMSTAKMYMIKTSNTQSISLEGDFVAEDRPITLNKGWNWIGYPVRESVDLRNALKNITPSAGDVIKSQTVTAIYNPLFEGWVFETGVDLIMTPGEGYMYYSESDESYTFTYSKGTGTPSRTASEPIEKHWIADATQYANNMSMIAMLSVDGEIVKGDYEIAAFANGECRGSARPVYIEAIDSYVLIMTISGEEVEELSFKYYDVNNGTEYELSNRVNYSNDAILGTAEEPYMLTLDITGVDEASISEINIYPNPTTIGSEINLQAICDKVEVFNALGVKVAEYQNVDSIDALETAGIYVIRVTDNNEVKHCRLVVK